MGVQRVRGYRDHPDVRNVRMTGLLSVGDEYRDGGAWSSGWLVLKRGRQGHVTGGGLRGQAARFGASVTEHFCIGCNRSHETNRPRAINQVRLNVIVVPAATFPMNSLLQRRSRGRLRRTSAANRPLGVENIAALLQLAGRGCRACRRTDPVA